MAANFNILPAALLEPVSYTHLLNNKSVNTRFKLNLKATIYPIGSKRNKNSTSTTVSNSILYIAITGFLINNNTQAETIPNPR